MKKLLLYSLLFLVSLTVFVACQKELSFEQPGPAGAELRQDTLGNCIPSLALGSFVAGRALADSNVLQVEVDVVKTGSYTIQTNEVNGYSFKATGTFTNTGVNAVKLVGTGTPGTEGEDVFEVKYGDSSSCLAVVLVLPAGSGGPAAFTLGATPNTCPTVAVGGTYSPGSPLTAANKIDFQVTVSAIGSYTLSTDTVNGFYFTASGAMLNTGVQTISLFGKGTPTTADSTTFKLTSGGTVCTFKVGVTGTTPPPPPASGDYFPLSQGSWWSYDDGAGTTDSFTITVTGTETINSKVYQRLIDPDFDDTSFYRKDAATGFYYNYIAAEDFLVGGPITFTQTGFEILFLKDVLKNGDTWSTDFMGTASGLPTTLRFKSTCINANASITVNGKVFSNVYQVDVESSFGVSTLPFTPIGTVNTYYAKGVGLIKVISPAGEQHIRNWKVN